MVLDVRVSSRLVAKLYRERDEYVLKYLPGTAPEDLVSLTRPAREEAWRWPRDLFLFFGRTCPRGICWALSAKSLGRCSMAPTCRCWACGRHRIGRVSVTPEDDKVLVVDRFDVDEQGIRIL